ncbi:MAG TPA: tRNA (N(6)-L-threonylcarbamoyladenosine(37)-C(2))-methylthiotransferase MtaB [Xanthobacteraceae bacterium]
MADGALPVPVLRSRPDDVEVVTFGCRLNAYESEQIKARAAADGVTETVIFNTCAVTAEAVRQARQAIRKASREHPDARIIVTGCAAQIDPAAFAAMPEVHLVLGNADKSAKGALGVTHGHNHPDARVRVNDIFDAAASPAPLADGLRERARAYVEVQNGCDHRCTFCIIPYGRGNSRSSAAGGVVEQVRRLAQSGINEVVLTGVDLTSWGADLPGQPTLGNLVGRILKLVPELPRLRLSSIDAAEIDADLMRCLADEPRLAPYLHLSLQAGDDMILKRMKRRHSRADAIAFCAQVRRLRPDIAFGADIIAGFPTETDEMFARSQDMVDECDLTFLHVFPYSPRPGTPAARMPQVDGTTIKERAKRLRRTGEVALRRRLDSEVGHARAVLIESATQGRTEHFVPVAIAGGTPGEVRTMTIAGHDGARLTVQS